MTEREARIAFNMIPDVGSVAVARLAAECGGSVAEAYERYPRKLDWEGREPDWRGELERAQKMKVRILTMGEADYPPQLLEIASPPLALYVVGDAAALSRAGVAMVGTRAASAYGLETAERFAFGLAERGWCVISGLARGIDAAAHKGAIAGGGVTAGVLGGALDKFYPSENRKLAREMVEKGGCVASEFPFGRSPDPQTFPQRNRVVSGLSRGVVAVECPLRSGTLITCTRAAEQGRIVMAVPGRIDWKSAQGCLHLIREGAAMVTSVDDVVEALTPIAGKRPKARPKPVQAELEPQPQPPSPKPVPPPPKPVGKPTGPEVRISVEEAMVLRNVPDSGATADQITRASGLSPARVNALLVELRLKGRVRFLPGNRVALKDF